MENKNIHTTEDALAKAIEALQAATAELEAATENFAAVAAETATQAETAKAIVEEHVEEKAEAESEEIVSEEVVSEEEKKEEEESSEEKTETVEEPATEEEPKKSGKASNVIFTLIRIVLVAALVAAIVIFVFLKNRESRVPAADVFKAVTAQVTTEKMEKTTDRYFKKYYGLNAADFDDVLYYAPVSNMDAEELLVVKLKNVDQAETVTDAILKRQADKEQSFEGYAPEQYALAQEYILDVQGNYILFVIDPEAEKIDSAFAGAL